MLLAPALDASIVLEIWASIVFHTLEDREAGRDDLGEPKLDDDKGGCYDLMLECELEGPALSSITAAATIPAFWFRSLFEKVNFRIFEIHHVVYEEPYGYGEDYRDNGSHAINHDT